MAARFNHFPQAIWDLRLSVNRAHLAALLWISCDIDGEIANLTVFEYLSITKRLVSMGISRSNLSSKERETMKFPIIGSK
jgi:hypothetical protein